jgi:hypothetical protein
MLISSIHFDRLDSGRDLVHLRLEPIQDRSEDSGVNHSKPAISRGLKSPVTAHLFSSYVDNGVVANEVKQSHGSSFIDEIASAPPRNDRFYSKKPE